MADETTTAAPKSGTQATTATAPAVPLTPERVAEMEAQIASYRASEAQAKKEERDAALAPVLELVNSPEWASLAAKVVAVEATMRGENFWPTLNSLKSIMENMPRQIV